MRRGRKFAEEHPTGIGAVIAAAVVLLVQKLTDVSFSEEESVILVGAIAGVLSLFTPRFREN